MASVDPAAVWRLLAGLRCRSVRHISSCNKPWESWGIHHHSVPSLVVGLAGRSQVDLRDGEITLLEPGDIVLIAPWVWHINRRPIAGGTTLVTGHVGPICDVELVQAEWTWFGQTPWAGIGQRIAALERARSDAGRRAAGDRLLATLAARTPGPRDVPPALSRMFGHAWRLRTQPITAREILAASGLSYSVAHELFVRYFAETPKQYLLRTRLSLAQHLLRGGLPLDQVWREAGFASRPDLTRRFRIATGMPPLAWQRLNRP